MRKSGFVIACLIIILYSCTKKSVPTSHVKTKLIDVERIYTKNCSRCHGATGTGEKGPDLTKSDFSKAEMIETITKGSGRMPPFEDDLSQKEIIALSDYLMGLRK
jgi:cytochrome c551